MCSHTFPYWSVIPPTHCPYCGACLACGAPRLAAPSWPYQPLPYYGPFYTTTVTC